MDRAEFTLSRPVCLSLPIEEADKLLQEKDGRCALVYLALLRAGGLAVLATPRGYVLENPASAPAQAVAALVSLGYAASDAAAAVARVDETLSVQEIITIALRSLSRI